MSKIDFTMTPEYLREHLHYDPETGLFVWKIAGPKRIIGKTAGSIHKRWGYLILRIKGANFRAHRLAWLYVHGEWPTNGLDHIDGNKLNNRIANLRDVPHRHNAENKRSAPSHSESQILGVRPRGTKFSARIRVNGLEVHLGCFSTKEEAHACYLESKRKLHAGNTL